METRHSLPETALRQTMSESRSNRSNVLKSTNLCFYSVFASFSVSQRELFRIHFCILQKGWPHESFLTVSGVQFALRKLSETAEQRSKTASMPFLALPVGDCNGTGSNTRMNNALQEEPDEPDEWQNDLPKFEKKKENLERRRMPSDSVSASSDRGLTWASSEEAK